jgi:hypothetical protein
LGGPESIEMKQLQDVQLNIDLVATQNRINFAKLLEKFHTGLLMYHETDLNEKKEKKEETEKTEKDEHRIFDYEGNY